MEGSTGDTVGKITFGDIIIDRLKTIEHKQDTAHDKLERIEKQVLITNGRVTTLEKEQVRTESIRTEALNRLNKIEDDYRDRQTKEKNEREIKDANEKSAEKKEMNFWRRLGFFVKDLLPLIISAVALWISVHQ